jgi:hypothetical protein
LLSSSCGTTKLASQEIDEGFLAHFVCELIRNIRQKCFWGRADLLRHFGDQFGRSKSQVLS